MKNILIYLILFCFFQCTPRHKGIEDSGYLLLLLQNNAGGRAGSSVLSLQKIDPLNYSGSCLDSFFGTTARNYFSIMALSLRNSNIERHSVSEATCSSFGFRSFGPRKKTEFGIEYSFYDCGPLTVACLPSAVQATGF